MNEPHALFHYNGMWHLFYQYNPVGPYWRNIRWGHWVSEDMVTWQSVRDAVVPTEGSVAPDGIWTGNVVFDGEGRPVLLITAGDDSRPYNNSNQNVALAVAKDYSDPCLTEWEIGDYAVVQTSQMGTAGEFRDAQAFGIGNERYMVVGGASDGRGTAHVFKTTSDALTDWQYMGQLFTPSVYKSEYGTVWEMPNLVPLPYEDGRQSGKYLFVFSPSTATTTYGIIRAPSTRRPAASFPILRRRSAWISGTTCSRAQRYTPIRRAGGYISAPSCRTSARTKSIISRAGRTRRDSRANCSCAPTALWGSNTSTRRPSRGKFLSPFRG